MQGGIYAPSIFIGAALGSAFGQIVHLVGDPLGLHLAAPQAYALVGECGFQALGLARACTAVLAGQQQHTTEARAAVERACSCGGGAAALCLPPLLTPAAPALHPHCPLQVWLPCWPPTARSPSPACCCCLS